MLFVTTLLEVMDANSSFLDPEESSEEERGLAVFNLTRARFLKWKELKSSKTFWLLVFASPQNRPFTRASWSWTVASDQEFRHVWTYPHRLCHGKEGAPCRFAAHPARCAKCKYHAGHYYSVTFDGSTRQDKAIAITVRFVNKQWVIIQRLVRIDNVAKFVAGTQLSQVLMESLFTDFQLWGKQVLAMITDGAAINRAAVRNLDPWKRFCRRWSDGQGVLCTAKKAPFLAIHNTPLLDITSAFRTRTIKDICADQDVCMMFKQSKKL